MRLSMAPHAADGGSSSVDRPAAGDGGERSGTDAAASAASRTAAGKIARSLVGDGAAQELESLSGGHGRRQGPPVDAPGVPKPYTVPPGWKAPTLGEQFRYAALKHPYYRYGYVGAVLFGLLGWAIASEEKKHEGVQLSSGQAAGGGTA